MADVPWTLRAACGLFVALALIFGSYNSLAQIVQPQDPGLGGIGGAGGFGGIGGQAGLGGGFGGNYPGGGGFQQNLGPPDAPPVFTGTGNSLYYGGNLSNRRHS